MERVDLTEIYQSVNKLGDFNNAKDLIKENKYLSAIQELDGTTWQCTKEKGYEEYGWGADEITVSCKDAEVEINAYSSYNPYLFTVVNGKLAIFESLMREEVIEGDISSGDHFDYDIMLDIVDFSGDKLEINQYKAGEGEEKSYLKCVKKTEKESTGSTRYRKKY